VTCPNGLTRQITAKRNVTFGCRLHQLPAASPVHHRGPREKVGSARAPRAATRAPPTRPRPSLASRLPPTPTDGRAVHRLAGRRRQPQGSLPRSREEQRLAPHPHRCLNLRKLLNLGLIRQDGTWTWPERQAPRPEGLNQPAEAGHDGHRRAERPRCRTKSADSNSPLDGPWRRSVRRHTRQPTQTGVLFSSLLAILGLSQEQESQAGQALPCFQPRCRQITREIPRLGRRGL
jgi:hypothetical protein